MTKRAALLGVRIAIGCALFTYASMNVQWPQVIRALMSANPLLLFIAFAASCVLIGFKAYRWQVLLQSSGVNINYWTILDYSTTANIHGSLTPGRIGEVSKVHMLRKHGVGGMQAAQTIVFDRILDLLPMVLLSIYAAWHVQLIPVGYAAGGAAIITGGMVIVLLLARKLNLLTGWSFQWNRIVLSMVMTFGVYVLCNYWIMSSLKLGTGVLISGGLAAAMGIATVLPVSIAGLGVRDVLLTSLAVQLAVTHEKMLSLSMVELFFTLIVPFAQRYLFLALNRIRTSASVASMF